MKEIVFFKYKSRGGGYHWELISHRLGKRNIFVLGLYKRFLILAGDVKGKRILDVGCGDGVLAHMLADRGAEVVGADASQEAITFARLKIAKKQKLRFEVGSAYGIQSPDNTFDIVLSSELIEHLQEPGQFLHELNRVWNGSGPLLVSTPIKLSYKPMDDNHVREYYVEEYMDLLSRLFDHVRVEQSYPVVWMECLQKRIFGKRLPKICMNLVNIVTGYNPFLSSCGWKFYAQQVGIMQRSSS